MASVIRQVSRRRMGTTAHCRRFDIWRSARWAGSPRLTRRLQGSGRQAVGSVALAELLRQLLRTIPIRALRLVEAALVLQLLVVGERAQRLLGPRRPSGHGLSVSGVAPTHQEHHDGGDSQYEDDRVNDHSSPYRDDQENDPQNEPQHLGPPLTLETSYPRRSPGHIASLRSMQTAATTPYLTTRSLGLVLLCLRERRLPLAGQILEGVRVK